MGMFESRGQTDFEFESVKGLFGNQVGVGDFECDVYTLDRIASLVNNRESTFAELFLDDVLAEAGSSFEDRHEALSIRI